MSHYFLSWHVEITKEENIGNLKMFILKSNVCNVTHNDGKLPEFVLKHSMLPN